MKTNLKDLEYTLNIINTQLMYTFQHLSYTIIVVDNYIVSLNLPMKKLTFRSSFNGEPIDLIAVYDYTVKSIQDLTEIAQKSFDRSGTGYAYTENKIRSLKQELVKNDILTGLQKNIEKQMKG